MELMVKASNVGDPWTLRREMLHASMLLSACGCIYDCVHAKDSKLALG
jgi:hypothetical protein